MYGQKHGSPWMLMLHRFACLVHEQLFAHHVNLRSDGWNRSLLHPGDLMIPRFNRNKCFLLEKYCRCCSKRHILCGKKNKTTTLLQKNTAMYLHYYNYSIFLCKSGSNKESSVFNAANNKLIQKRILKNKLALLLLKSEGSSANTWGAAEVSVC